MLAALMLGIVPAGMPTARVCTRSLVLVSTAKAPKRKFKPSRTGKGLPGFSFTYPQRAASRPWRSRIASRSRGRICTSTTRS